MKTIDIKATQSVVQAPARPPQGAPITTGGGLAGGAGMLIAAPDPQVPAQKPRRKLPGGRTKRLEPLQHRA
jgi:hypothetical protein